ncbi:PP2C family protein-serine/threonine phosphatase [Streptomyces swartbergensis]|uniref:PP2C family protein-serine/threonine phosphatase n=1 Tax=Streptomyces swartbergensis TaxID=487165 RepID=UPI00382DC081
MTDTSDPWKIGSVSEAARARTTVARLLADADVPLVQRTRFLTSLTARLRECLDRDGDWELLITTQPATDEAPGHVGAAVRPAGHPPQEPPPWIRTLTCSPPARPPGPRAADAGDAALAEMLLAADDDSAVVLSRLDKQEELVRFHREELHQTNQGVLALHAELEAAAHLQRQLLDAERAARTEAENARRLLTFLADASAAVTASLDHEDILRRLPDLLVPEYASQAGVWLLHDEETSRIGHRPAAALAAARTGRPQHAAAHPSGLPGIDDLPPSALAPTQPLLCIPLTARHVIGVLTLRAPGDRFAPDTCVMLIELARRIGIALDNALRYEQHRDTAEALQRAQLTDLPASEGLHLAARYLPATHGLNIGGDWYDAFEQRDGSLLAVIGDVTGHGLHAAVMMGQLRTALRAYAAEEDGPGRILTRLHRLLRHQQPDLYATAAIVRFRPGEPTATWASAGHPPPAVRTPEGAVTVLDTKPGIMLGVPLPYTYEEHALELTPGSTIALYTDGLVERRALGIDTGIDRLARALAALSTRQLEQDLDVAAEALLKPMLYDSAGDDDVCLLLCRTSALPPPPPAQDVQRRVPHPCSPASRAGTKSLGRSS